MRDKRKRTIDVEIPAEQHGSLVPEATWEVVPALAPAGVKAPAVMPLPDVEEAVIVIDVTS